MKPTETPGCEFQAAWNECLLNDKPIDWEFWVQKMPTLSVLQAAGLMHGLDPSVHRDFSLAEPDADIKNALLNAEKSHELAKALGLDQLTPPAWLDWADSNNLVVHALYRLEVQKKCVMPHAPHATQAGQLKPHKEKVMPDWIPEAQKRALSYLKQQLARDLHPSQVDVADWVAEQFRREAIYGAQGKPISGATIKRHALPRISAQQDKLKQIEKQWGKRGEK